MRSLHDFVTHLVAAMPILLDRFERPSSFVTLGLGFFSTFTEPAGFQLRSLLSKLQLNFSSFSQLLMILLMFLVMVVLQPGRGVNVNEGRRKPSSEDSRKDTFRYYESRLYSYQDRHLQGSMHILQNGAELGKTTPITSISLQIDFEFNRWPGSSDVLHSLDGCHLRFIAPSTRC